jgi:Domain of unknown function (DUF3806)
MTRIVEAMNAEETARVEAQRSWVRDHFAPGARSGYETIEGKLTLLETILSSDWIDATETLKLQCLGVAFGDAMAQRLGLHWATVEDEYGRDPALKRDGTSLLALPLTSISKRIERGETVDVRALFESACSAIEHAVRDGA